MSNLRLLFSDNNAATADFVLHCVFRKTPNTQGGANLESDEAKCYETSSIPD